MKTKTIFVLVLLFSIASIISCKKNEEKKNIDNYVGSWSVTGNCGKPYTMTITASGSTLTLSKLQNCYTVTASVSGNNLTIATQTLDASTSSCGYPYTVSGSGIIDGNTLQLTYTVKDISGTTSNCSSTATK
ncbi:MAG: hypothetical protein V1781_09605 [Bacteroidota bacterium]